MKISSKAILFGATALSAAIAAPAFGQDAEENRAASSGDIIVTAQRVEQRLQDVPISITVFSQEKLDNNNILSAKDIATYTPGVYAQTRFGNDVTTYTIRGFAQEQRTTATVGTYFAEVVAPRGNGVSQGGDGASPGAMFDLQNVQVLKGPQGTLFGRNTTGGAVLLVPVKPRNEFEGYVEGTYGDLDRMRIQGVVNVPLGESLRVRLGVDRHKRDGYIKNIGISAKNDRDMGSIDILALRGSLVWDITPDIENYTIVTYSESKGSGAIPLVKAIFRNADGTNRNFTGLASAQIAREAAAGDFWTGTNSNPNAEARFEEFRVINRTTVQLSDTLTLTNLFGYSELKGNNAVDAFGLNSPLVASPTVQNDYFSYVPIAPNPDFGLTANQKTIVEELRLTGETDQFRWQAGLYYEKSSPKDFTGTMSPTAQRCTDVQQFKCTSTGGGASSATISANKVWNSSIAAYAQATYNITEQLAITGGIRYTEDKSRANYMNGRVSFSPATNFAGNTFGCSFPGLPDSGLVFANTPENRATRCFLQASTKTGAPTWLLGLDYKPVEGVLLYAKWSRGYRQGSVVPPAPPGLEAYGEEKVDTYEIGGKTSWSGPVRGTFNIAAFYNDFRGQQIQAGISNPSSTLQTSAIVNADKSRLYGFEADMMVEPADWFRLEAAYSYNNTKLQKITFPDLTSIGLIVRPLAVGGPIPLAVPHALNATATFTLPLDESIGKVSISGTIVHMSSFRAVADAVAANPGTGVLPKRTFGNANITWKGVAGLPVDLAFYATNITNEKMFTHINDQSNNGFISYSVDEPRQFGVRLKYRFGGLAD